MWSDQDEWSDIHKSGVHLDEYISGTPNLKLYTWLYTHISICSRDTGETYEVHDCEDIGYFNSECISKWEIYEPLK